MKGAALTLATGSAGLWSGCGANPAATAGIGRAGGTGIPAGLVKSAACSRAEARASQMTFAFTGRACTSIHLAPRAKLEAVGLNQERDLKKKVRCTMLHLTVDSDPIRLPEES